MIEIVRVVSMISFLFLCVCVCSGGGGMGIICDELASLCTFLLRK